KSEAKTEVKSETPVKATTVKPVQISVPESDEVEAIEVPVNVSVKSETPVKAEVKTDDNVKEAKIVSSFSPDIQAEEEPKVNNSVDLPAPKTEAKADSTSENSAVKTQTSVKAELTVESNPVIALE